MRNSRDLIKFPKPKRGKHYEIKSSILKKQIQKTLRHFGNLFKDSQLEAKNRSRGKPSMLKDEPLQTTKRF